LFKRQIYRTSIVLLTAETQVGQIQVVLKAQRKEMVGLLDSATDPPNTALLVPQGAIVPPAETPCISV
jgi:hypothetical protein